MLMQEPTPEMTAKWKKIWNQYKDKLHANRKSGQEIINYLLNKYTLTEIHDDKAKQVIAHNILANKSLAERLPAGTKPSPAAFFVENEGQGQTLFENQDEIFKGSKIFVGIDLVSGFYLVEGSSMLWDELCAFQGVDEKDIENYYCVTQYISCLERFGLLEQVVGEK